ncbi:MAG: hypothetical protein R6U58_11630, partial [Bacteroidales bacterium]
EKLWKYSQQFTGHREIINRLNGHSALNPAKMIWTEGYQGRNTGFVMTKGPALTNIDVNLP